MPHRLLLYIQSKTLYKCLFYNSLNRKHKPAKEVFMGKRELVALLNLSTLCLVKVERLFLAVPQGCLQFVIVVLPDHTHLLFLVTYTCD